MVFGGRGKHQKMTGHICSGAASICTCGGKRLRGWMLTSITSRGDGLRGGGGADAPVGCGGEVNINHYHLQVTFVYIFHE